MATRILRKFRLLWTRWLLQLRRCMTARPQIEAMRRRHDASRESSREEAEDVVVVGGCWTALVIASARHRDYYKGALYAAIFFVPLAIAELAVFCWM